MTAPDPVAALREASGDTSLPSGIRRALAEVDEDGVRISALLVAKLRFERLLRGSPVAERWFDEDPETFASVFRRYHAAVRATAFFPPDEARAFHDYVGERGPSRTGPASPSAR